MNNIRNKYIAGLSTNRLDKAINSCKADTVVVNITKLLLVFTALYILNEGFIGISSPGNTYIPFLDHYLNYIDWLRYSILHTANGITRLFNYNTVVSQPYKLRLVEGPGVQMVYSCIGYSIMSFWAAFVIVSKAGTRYKWTWLLGGLLCIWFINCVRVASLLIVHLKGWNINKYLDHHTLFNYVAYSLILVLMYLYTRKRSFSEEPGEAG